MHRSGKWARCTGPATVSRMLRTQQVRREPLETLLKMGHASFLAGVPLTDQEASMLGSMLRIHPAGSAALQTTSRRFAKR